MDEIAELCRQQRGVISRRQVLGAGLGGHAIRDRLRSRRWHRMHAGVYATFTGEPSRAAWRWAAVLRAGRGAVLTGHAAAEEVGLADESAGAVITVAIPAERRVVAVPGLAIRRCDHAVSRRHPSLLPPQTRVEETVLDLAAGSGSVAEAAAWVAEACRQGLTTSRAVARALRRRERAVRGPDLRQLLAWDGPALAWRYVRDVERAHGLPAGDDLVYPQHRVRIAFEGHPRPAVPGEVVLRFGVAEISGSPCEVAFRVAEVLRRREPWWGGRACGPACRFVAAVSA